MQDRDTAAAETGKITRHCPIDMIVAGFSGDVLTLRAGRDSSSWSDFSILFEDVVYMSLPTYMDSVTVRLGDAAAHDRVRAACHAYSDDLVIVELIEDQDWPEGVKTHLVAAAAIQFHGGSDANKAVGDAS